MRNTRGCQSCTKCWGVGSCVVEDDFAPALADHNPVHGRFVPGKQFVLIHTQAAPADMYEALFEKCAGIMRDCVVKDSHWLHCPGLWVHDMEGQTERLQSYEQQAREIARKITV